MTDLKWNENKSVDLDRKESINQVHFYSIEDMWVFLDETTEAALRAEPATEATPQWSSAASQTLFYFSGTSVRVHTGEHQTDHTA